MSGTKRSHRDEPGSFKSSPPDKSSPAESSPPDKSSPAESSPPEEKLVSAEPGSLAYTKSGGSLAVDTHGVKGPADFDGPHPGLEQPEDTDEEQT